jgi:hypothetical protein
MPPKLKLAPALVPAKLSSHPVRRLAGDLQMVGMIIMPRRAPEEQIVQVLHPFIPAAVSHHFGFEGSR